MNRDLTKGNIGKNMLLFSLPLMVGNLLQQLYNLVDTWVVGRFVGADALAAVGASYSLMVFLTSVYIGLCMGSGSAFSMFFGKRDEDSMKKSFFSSFVLIGAVSIIINVGVYLGALNVLGSQLDDEELIALFKGELKDELKWEKLSHNRFTNSFAQYCIGLKEHMGHFLLTDEQIERLYHITSESGLVFMSHTQDPEHSARLVELSKGRQIHLGHTNAAGCGTHTEAEEGMKAVIGLCKHPNVTGEFVTTMLRRGLGNLEGLKMTKASRQRALDALNEKVVDILVSDGQNQSTMKGFGDTRDNIPCILELVEEGVLDKSAAVAAMTSNPCRYLAEVTGCDEWKCKYGTLREGAYANILIVDTENKRASYTITNGEPVSFEGRYIRGHGYAGNWVSRFGTSRTGVGDAPMYSTDN